MYLEIYDLAVVLKKGIELDCFEEEVHKLFPGSTYVQKYDDGTIAIGDGDGDLYCWDKDLKRILEEYCQEWFADALAEDEYPVRLCKRPTGEPMWSWAQDLSYYPGYEEEFVKELPPEVIQEVLRQYQK